MIFYSLSQIYYLFRQHYHTYPKLRPVTDNIEKLAKILLRYVGLAQQNGLEIVHIDEEIFVSGVYPQGV